MPEARGNLATRDPATTQGAPYKPARRRVLGQKQRRPHAEVAESKEVNELRELSEPAQPRQADDRQGRKIEFPTYEGGDTVVRSLTNAADMSGADGARGVVMMSFNWSCDVSKDDGATWRRLDPTTVFPNTLGGGFCCDQIVIYVPKAQMFFWLLQYSADSAGQGAFRLAAAGWESVRDDPTAWTYWDFMAGDFGYATSDMDYPDLSYSDQFLYASTDIFSSGRVVMRISLEELRAGGTINYSYTEPDDGKQCWGAHLVQQTGNRGMWAGHTDNSHLDLFTWPDNSATYSWSSVKVATWPNGTLSSTGPDGNDWLKKLDNFPSFAITGGVQISSDRIALAWTASSGQANGQGKDFKQAHVRYVEIDPNSHSTLREIPVWNDDYAFAYPSLARAEEAVGITLGWGGPSDHSNCAMGIMGDYVVWFIDASTRTVNRFGDYLTARASQSGGGFSAFAYWLESVAANPNQVTYHPFFTRFRRP